MQRKAEKPKPFLESIDEVGKIYDYMIASLSKDKQ